MEVTTRFELVDEGFADPCLTTWPRHHIWSNCCCSIWSGRRGSNSLPPPWQGGALPDELRPHMFQSLQATFVIITDLSQKVKGFLAFCSTFFQIFFPSRYPTHGLFQLRFSPSFCRLGLAADFYICIAILIMLHPMLFSCIPGSK